LATDLGKFDLKDQIIYEPFVGAGAMFLPLRNKGAVLIGSDIDIEALEICKQLVPEAILIYHDTLGCQNPARLIKRFQKEIEQIQALTNRNKRQIAEDKKNIEELEN
jgi:site-specific DNA-adenine methylase